MHASDGDSYRALGTTGLSCHSLGFGCYRIADGIDEHEAALRGYLEAGGNLIDTSANYGDGMSEVLVGRILQDCGRDRAIVVTKGGYIQGRNLEMARQRDFPDVVRYGPGIWHCIHPEFLRTQIDGSLDRLRLDELDIYLLHNPEYFLEDKAHHGTITPRDHDEFYERIGTAFSYLEREVKGGRIRWYGVSSNNFGHPSSHAAMTSVARCLEAAEAIASDHHFRVVQLPLNLFEAGGAKIRNSDGLSALEFCAREGLGVLANRPLNAFSGGRLIRLADHVRPGKRPSGPDELRTVLEPLRAHERRLAGELGRPLPAGGEGMAAVIERIVPDMRSTAEWEHEAGHEVIQPLRAWLETGQRAFARDVRWQAWVEELTRILPSVFEGIARLLAHKDQRFSDAVRGRLLEAGYPEGGESLSRMALHVLLNLSGLACVLNGMRTRDYVADSMGAASLPPLDALSILRRFH